MATLSPKVPSLPPELWREIIHQVPHRPFELTSLWLDIRNVNHLLRALVEDVFMSEHLEWTRLGFRIEFGFRTMDPPMDISFAFSRLNDADRNAIFIVNQSKRYKRAREFEDFQSKQQSFSRDKIALLPQHVIYFHGSMLVNDTELPIIGRNAPKAEISIDWRSLFTGFFRDARLCQRDLKQEWAKRIPNGSCWDSWEPACAKHSENTWYTSQRRDHILSPGRIIYQVDEVRRELSILGFRGTQDLDFSNAVSLLRSYSEINLAARIRTRRQRMKQHIKRVSWKDGVEQYFASEIFAIQEIDLEWRHFTDGVYKPNCSPQKWVTLRYSHQLELAKEL